MVHAAMASAGLKQPPDVLITLAARFGRVAWKYQSVAYALILKNVGGLYQQMYLVATALGLSPCALGAGNSDTFAQATGLDYFAETSVGEFLLSGADSSGRLKP
jgi:SagB-type dehydrogenase family enzyme